MVRGEQFDGRFAGQYAQVWSSSVANNTWDLHSYASGSDSGGEKWRSHYWSIGKNIDLIVEDATAKQKWDYVGVAKAIRAWSWQSTTDWHGEMILKQAWEPNRYVFDFDSQEEVYAEVVRLSNEALTFLAKSDGAVGSLYLGDKVFQGDRAKWTKFVYANLARNANHLSNKSTYSADKVIEYCDKSLASNLDNFNAPHRGLSTTDANFFGPLRDNMQSFRQTDFSISLLDGRVFGVTDPRLPLMFTASVDGVFRGVTPGSIDANATPVDNPKRVSILWGVAPSALVGKTPNDITQGKYIYKNDAAFPIFTYAEIQFIKAEAAFKKGDKGLALTAYKNGIGAHLDYVGVAAKDKTDFLASKAVKQNAGDLTLADIMGQKFIAMYGHGNVETWVDLRRYKYDPTVYTGFTLPRALSTDNNGKTVQRVRPRYNSEYVWNRVSLDKIGGNNADYHTYELWFMKP
jgi:hypothetical protein